MYKKHHTKAQKESMRRYMRGYAKKTRLVCLIFYGGNPPKCACCNEAMYQFLGIDHINGGGNKHRKTLSLSGKKSTFGGQTVYRWLINNNFPDGFQVLCHNCNLAKGYYGECPHKTGDILLP